MFSSKYCYSFWKIIFPRSASVSHVCNTQVSKCYEMFNDVLQLLQEISNISADVQSKQQPAEMNCVPVSQNSTKRSAKFQRHTLRNTKACDQFQPIMCKENRKVMCFLQSGGKLKLEEMQMISQRSTTLSWSRYRLSLSPEEDIFCFWITSIPKKHVHLRRMLFSLRR